MAGRAVSPSSSCFYCTTDGQVGRYAEDQRTTVQDWRLIGTEYRWSLFTVFLHDFVLKLGPITKHMREAATLVQHPDFIHIVERPAKGYKLEVAIGYPFIAYAPIPNYFGFGPGKFDWAVKLFSFMLRDNNEIRCSMDFAAGARPARRCSISAGTSRVRCTGVPPALHAISLGLFQRAERFHDWMDGAMVAQHARVHQALMEGAAKVFAGTRQSWNVIGLCSDHAHPLALTAASATLPDTPLLLSACLSESRSG